MEIQILKTHSSRVDHETLETIKGYLESICASDCAVAEPSCDSSLGWLPTTLVMGLTEAYFEDVSANRVLMGFYCETCNCIEMHIQSYTLEPELCLMALTDSHHEHKFAAVYMEV